MTFREFATRMENEFGVRASGSGLLATGFRASDKLEPYDIRCLCDQVGVPAEDFGVDV